MTLDFPSAVDFEDQSKCDYRLIESFRIIQNDTKSFRLILNPRQFKFTRTATDTSPFLITFLLHVLKADVFFLVGHSTTNTVPERLNRGRLHRNSFVNITSVNGNNSLFILPASKFKWKWSFSASSSQSKCTKTSVRLGFSRWVENFNLKLIDHVSNWNFGAFWMRRKCTKIAVSWICHHIRNLIRILFALQFRTLCWMLIGFSNEGPIRRNSSFSGLNHSQVHF